MIEPLDIPSRPLSRADSNESRRSARDAIKKKKPFKANGILGVKTYKQH